MKCTSELIFANLVIHKFMKATLSASSSKFNFGWNYKQNVRPKKGETESSFLDRSKIAQREENLDGWNLSESAERTKVHSAGSAGGKFGNGNYRGISCDELPTEFPFSWRNREHRDAQVLQRNSARGALQCSFDTDS